jgi:hypothetical protein
MMQPALTERLATEHRHDLLRQAEFCRADEARLCRPATPRTRRSGRALRTAARAIVRWA